MQKWQQCYNNYNYYYNDIVAQMKISNIENRFCSLLIQVMQIKSFLKLCRANIYTEKLSVSHITPGTSCQTTGCNKSRKHQGIHIFNIPKPKSGIRDHIEWRKKHERMIFFSVLRLFFFLLASCNLDKIATVFLKKTAFVIATLDAETLH